MWVRVSLAPKPCVRAALPLLVSTSELELRNEESCAPKRVIQQ